MIIKLEGRNTDIPFYGLSDLLELIDLIAADKEDKVMDVFFTFWIWGPGSQLGYFLLQRLGPAGAHRLHRDPTDPHCFKRFKVRS